MIKLGKRGDLRGQPSIKRRDGDRRLTPPLFPASRWWLLLRSLPRSRGQPERRNDFEAGLMDSSRKWIANCRRTCAPIAAYSSQVQLCIDAAGGSLLNSSSGTDTEIYFLRFAGLALTTAQLLHPNALRRNLRSTAGFRRTKILRLSKALVCGFNFRRHRERQLEFLCNNAFNVRLDCFVLRQPGLHRPWQIRQVGFRRIMQKPKQLQVRWQEARNS